MTSRSRVVAVLSPDIAVAQASGRLAMATEAAVNGTTLRTSWGDPDLQGTWTNTTTTPFERASDPAPGAERSNRQSTPGEYDPNVSSVGAYNEFWAERGGPSSQTSLVVDPEDGKLPPLTPEAQQWSSLAVQRWSRHDVTPCRVRAG
jgi:hypothetical protein